MRTVNKVILIGNVTKEPFVKTTMGGKKVALFTVATNRYFKDAMGQPQSEAEYTVCSAWGVLADRCEQYLTKGKLVYVEGHLKTRSIDKEDGTRVFKTEVVVTNLIFLSKKEYEESSYGSEQEDNMSDMPAFEDAPFEDKF